MIIVFPTYFGWKGHEDGFGSAFALQAEDSAAIVDKIKLYVSTSSILLKCFFSFSVGDRFSQSDNGRVDIGEGVADAFHECEGIIEPAAIEIVEENAADASGLIAVGEEEVAIALVFELWI